MIEKIVEWGSTYFEEFTTQALSGSTYSNVDPDTIECKLETYAGTPVEVADLTYEKQSTGVYYVMFYADKTLYSTGTSYYLTMYWIYDDKSMCERVAIQIVVDKK
jgi:hypothetical protein